MDSNSRDHLISILPEYDVFINNAWAPVAQAELLRRAIETYAWSKRVIVNMSSKVIYFDDDMIELIGESSRVKSYQQDKINMQQIVNQNYVYTKAKVINLQIGGIDTQMIADSSIPKMDPASVAEFVYSLCILDCNIHVQDILFDAHRHYM